jgi:hypothetical protein
VPLGFWHPAFLTALLYFPAMLGTSAYLAIGNGTPMLAPQIALVFFCTHFGYSWGMLGQFLGLTGKR